jgi:hypothetical protein
VRLRLPALLLAGLAAAPAPSQPPARPAVPPVSPQPAQRALVLARIIAPASLLVDKEVAEARRSFESAIAESPRARAAEAAHPGLYAFAWRETEPLMRSLSQASQEALHRKLAAMLSARLTGEETEALIAYYSSPLGQRGIRASIAGIRVQPDGRPPAATPGLAERVAKETLGSMTAADEAVVLELGRHIGIEKFRAVGAEVQRIELEAVVEAEPVIQARIGAALQEAMNRYVTRARRR